MGARARRAPAVAARASRPFRPRAPGPPIEAASCRPHARPRAAPNYARRPVSSTYAPAAFLPPWLQNRTLCMHAALSQLPTPNPSPAGPAGSTPRWLPRLPPARSFAVALACSSRRRGNPAAGRGLLRHRFCPSRRAHAVQASTTFFFPSFACPDPITIDGSTTSGCVRGLDLDARAN